MLPCTSRGVVQEIWLSASRETGLWVQSAGDTGWWVLEVGQGGHSLVNFRSVYRLCYSLRFSTVYSWEWG